MTRKREFWCDTCYPQIEGSPVMNVAELKVHLRDFHKLDSKVSGRLSLISAFDDGDFYKNTFEWKLGGGVKITEVSSGSKP